MIYMSQCSVKGEGQRRRGGLGGWVQTVSAESDTHGCVKLFGLTGELEKVRGYFWLLAQGTIELLSEAAQRDGAREGRLMVRLNV